MSEITKGLKHLLRDAICYPETHRSRWRAMVERSCPPSSIVDPSALPAANGQTGQEPPRFNSLPLAVRSAEHRLSYSPPDKRLRYDCSSSGRLRWQPLNRANIFLFHRSDRGRTGAEGSWLSTVGAA